MLRPAVSVGGSTTFGVAGELATAIASGAGPHSDPDLSYLDLDSSYNLPASTDADSYVFEGEFFPPFDSSDSESNTPFGDEGFAFEDFITNETHDHVGQPLEQQPQPSTFDSVVNDASLFVPETQVS